MENDQISSSSDEFDFAALDDELTLISGGLCRETNESSGEDNDGVRDYDEVLPNVQFIPGQNPTAPQIMSNVQEPIDFLQLFFTNKLEKKIIRETIKYAKRKLEGKTLSATSIWRSWRDVTNEEFWAFLAVVINIGTMPLANLQEYWSKNVVSHIPFYSETFTRDRFSQIFWMLHLETLPTHTTNPRTRLQRVSCFLDYLNSKFLDYFIPDEHICVDESTIKYKGRISFITYIQSEETDKVGHQSLYFS
nr:PREDICTED: piggyBac transposable element-derived protein 4-like [Megachile rotundata]